LIGGGPVPTVSTSRATPCRVAMRPYTVAQGEARLPWSNALRRCMLEGLRKARMIVFPEFLPVCRVVGRRAQADEKHSLVPGARHGARPRAVRAVRGWWGRSSGRAVRSTGSQSMDRTAPPRRSIASRGVGSKGDDHLLQLDLARLAYTGNAPRRCRAVRRKTRSLSLFPDGWRPPGIGLVLANDDRVPRSCAWWRLPLCPRRRPAAAFCLGQGGRRADGPRAIFWSAKLPPGGVPRAPRARPQVGEPPDDGQQVVLGKSCGDSDRRPAGPDCPRRFASCSRPAGDSLRLGLGRCGRLSEPPCPSIPVVDSPRTSWIRGRPIRAPPPGKAVGPGGAWTSLRSLVQPNAGGPAGGGDAP